MTFGLAGIGTIVISWLLLRGALLSRGVAILGTVSGALLIALYLAYLALLDPTNPLVVILVLATGVIQPVWNLWVGRLVSQQGTVARRAQ